MIKRASFWKINLSPNKISKTISSLVFFECYLLKPTQSFLGNLYGLGNDVKCHQIRPG